MPYSHKLTRIACGVAAALAWGGAHALVPSAGTDPQNAFLIDSFDASGSFEQVWLFDLSTVSSVSSTAFSQWFGGATDGLRNLTIELFQGNTLLQSVGPSTPIVIGGPTGALTTVSLNDLLPAGTYRLMLSGDIQAQGGNYFWSLNTVAIPEPETWAMMLVGMGLVGWQLRRKVKSSAASKFV